MFKLRFRVSDYLLLGSLFWCFQIPAALWMSRSDFPSVWKLLLGTLVDGLSPVPEKFQTPVAVAFLLAAVLVILSTGIFLDITSSNYGHGKAVMHVHVQLNRDWLSDLASRNAKFFGDDLRLMADEYVGFWDGFLFWRKRKLPMRSELAFERRAERIEAFLVAGIFQYGSPTVRMHTIQLLRQARLVRGFCDVLFFVWLEYFVVTAWRLLSSTFPGNGSEIGFALVFSYLWAPTLIGIVAGAIFVGMVRRSHSRVAHHIFAANYILWSKSNKHFVEERGTNRTGVHELPVGQIGDAKSVRPLCVQESGDGKECVEDAGNDKAVRCVQGSDGDTKTLGDVG